MKWKKKNDIPIANSTEFMKINSFNFIENEKLNSALVHEKNVGKILSFKAPGDEPVVQNLITQTSIVPVLENKENVEESWSEQNMSEVFSVTKSRTDFSGLTPKKYITTCFIKPTLVPNWYSESVTLKTNSTKKRYTEKVYFKKTHEPYHWSEGCYVAQAVPWRIVSEISIPIEDCEYISLVPQQQAATEVNNLTEL